MLRRRGALEWSCLVLRVSVVVDVMACHACLSLDDVCCISLDVCAAACLGMLLAFFSRLDPILHAS